MILARSWQDQSWNAKADEIQGYADRREPKDFYAASKDAYVLHTALQSL